MSLRVPEIFIVGTMKGGTTILYDYISSHPRVVAGSQKELHYFSLFPDRGLDWYLGQFPDRPEDTLSIDASPTYFDLATSTAIPGHIKAAAPDSKVIIIVRDPIERAVSHFEHLRTISHRELFSGIEINEFFSRPLERLFVEITASDELFGYVVNFSLYYRKLMNFLKVFGKDRVLVLTNASLRTEAEPVMRRVFTHCGLEWAPSAVFGTERYLSGSRNIQLLPDVVERLAALLYPDYEKFCRVVGLHDYQPHLSPVKVSATNGVSQ